MRAHTAALQPAHIDSDDDDDGDDGSYTNCDVTHTVQLLGRVDDGVPRPEAHGRTCSISVTAAGTRDWKTQDWKTWDQIAGVEKAGLENTGTSCEWVAKCNIINVRGHVRVNVTISDFANHVFVT